MDKNLIKFFESVYNETHLEEARSKHYYIAKWEGMNGEMVRVPKQLEEEMNAKYTKPTEMEAFLKAKSSVKNRKIVVEEDTSIGWGKSLD